VADFTTTSIRATPLLLVLFPSGRAASVQPDKGLKSWLIENHAPTDTDEPQTIAPEVEQPTATVTLNG